VQTITGLHTPPAGVPAGETGAAARAESAQTLSTIGLGAFGLLLAAAAVLVVARRKVGSRA
jgi:hypothetical protein